MPPFETHSPAEEKVYRLLKSTLPSPPYEILPSTAYVASRKKGGMIEGELDALIFHPDKGILVIEVKGGAVRYDGTERQWYSMDLNGDEHRVKDPFRQVQNASRFLKSLVTETKVFSSGVPIPIGHAVFFPDATWECGMLPSHARRELIVGSSELVNLETSLDRIMGLFRSETHRSLAKKESAAIRTRVLYPTCRVVQTVKSRMDKEEIDLVRMTEEQKRLLDWLGSTKQIAIKGYAGTGKTLLAMEKARRLGDLGLRVALICFNRPLADEMRKSLIHWSDSVHVSNYHTLCRKLCEETTVPFDIPSGSEERFQAFWDEVAPLKLMEATEKMADRYEAVIVDEGQDFRPNWWISLKELLSDQERGYFYVFLDPGQSIYCAEIDIPVPMSSVVLTTNCRNTKRIGRVVSEVAGVEMNWPSYAPDGKYPTFVPYSSMSDQLAKIGDCVRDLTNEGIQPHDIVCLSTHSRANSCMEGISQIAGVPITDDLLTPGDAIRFSSLHRFKGLEGNVVILCDVDSDHEHCKAEHLYVAVSRAKHLLYVFHKEGWSMPRGPDRSCIEVR